MLAEQHSQGSPLSKVVENNFGTRNGIEQYGQLCNEVKAVFNRFKAWQVVCIGAYA